MEVRDIVVGRKYEDKNGNDKTAWTKIGKLFIKNENGEMKISGILEATPIGGNGNFQAFVPRPKEGGQFNSSNGSQPAPKDDVPTIDLDQDTQEIRIEDVPF